MHHVFRPPPPRDRCCWTDRQRLIHLGTNVIADDSRTIMNMISNCLMEFGSGFEFRIVLLYVWLPTMATEAKLAFYLPIITDFEVRIFHSPRQFATQIHRTQYYLLSTHSIHLTTNNVGYIYTCFPKMTYFIFNVQLKSHSLKYKFLEW